MKRRSILLLSTLPVLLGSCFDVYGSELMQGGPEGYVFYYGLESMQSDGGNRKKLLESIYLPGYADLPIETQSRFFSIKNTIVVNNQNKGLYGYCYYMDHAVLFSYSYETSEVKLIQELPVMMEARFEVFGKETFLVSGEEFYCVSDPTIPHYEGALQYANSMGYVAMNYERDEEGMIQSSKFAFYSYAGEELCTLPKTETSAYTENGRFIRWNDPDASPTFFAPSLEKLYVFDINSEKKPKTISYEGKSVRPLAYQNGFMKEGSCLSYVGWEDEFLSSYYAFQEEGRTHLGKWDDSSWKRQLPTGFEFGDGGEVLEQNAVWLRSSKAGQSGLLYSTKQDEFKEEALFGQVNGKKNSAYSYPLLETENFSFEVRTSYAASRFIDSYKTTGLLVRTNKKNGFVRKMQTKTLVNYQFDYSFFPDYVDTSKSL